MWIFTALLFVVFAVANVGGDKFKVVAVSYAGDVTMANVSDTGKLYLRVVQDDGSCPPIQRIRRYCAHTCEESYNQLLVNEKYLFVFSNRSALIVSNIDQELKTVKKQCITLPSCDPLVSTYEWIGTPYVHVHCSPESWNEYTVTVHTLWHTANGGWNNVTHTCEPHHKPNGVSAIFFSSQDDILYLAYTTDVGMGFCGITEKSDQPDPILPDKCPWIAKISRFNNFSLLVECTSGDTSKLVIVAWVYSWLKAEFVQKLPVNNYPLGQLVFSSDNLFCATYQEKDIRVMNLTNKNNGRVYLSTATDVINSAQFIIVGSFLQLVVSHSQGVDVIKVDKSGPKSRTLEGSGKISLPVGNTPPPPLTLISNQYAAYVTENSRITLSSLSKNVSYSFLALNLARYEFLELPVPNSTESSTKDNLLSNGLAISLTSSSVLGLCILAILISLFAGYMVTTRRKRRRHMLLDSSSVTSDTEETTPYGDDEGNVPSSNPEESTLSSAVQTRVSVECSGNVPTPLGTNIVENPMTNQISQEGKDLIGDVEPREAITPQQESGLYSEECVLPNRFPLPSPPDINSRPQPTGGTG